MSRHDYTQHSKKNQNEVNEVDEELEIDSIKPTEEAEIENEVETETNAIAEVEDETKSEAEVRTSGYDLGVVIGCAKLRVRSEPRFGANVICEIEQGTRVMINRSESTFDYYKIYTESGVEGFCIKTYVA